MSQNGSLDGKRVVVLGASRGIGREIVERAHAEGGRVLAVARQAGNMADYAGRGIDTLAIDAASEGAPAVVFQAAHPDVLIICGGAIPPTRPIPELSWAEFSINWEVDTRMAFLFCREALRRPLAPESVVVIISSGAGLGGSPISGGYAGAKRMEMFLARYAQIESDRLGLGIRFISLVPFGPMPQTQLGRIAVDGYAQYRGVSPQDFIGNLGARPSPAEVARAAVDVAIRPPADGGSIFTIGADGLKVAS